MLFQIILLSRFFPPGRNGYTGATGDSGVSGNIGDTGVMGFTGQQGVRGILGVGVMRKSCAFTYDIFFNNLYFNFIYLFMPKSFGFKQNSVFAIKFQIFVTVSFILPFFTNNSSELKTDFEESISHTQQMMKMLDHSSIALDTITIIFFIWATLLSIAITAMVTILAVRFRRLARRKKEIERKNNNNTLKFSADVVEETKYEDQKSEVRLKHEESFKTFKNNNKFASIVIPDGLNNSAIPSSDNKLRVPKTSKKKKASLVVFSDQGCSET